MGSTSEKRTGYEKPKLVDYGDLLKLTAGGRDRGCEDGGMKGNRGFHMTNPSCGAGN